MRAALGEVDPTLVVRPWLFGVTFGTFAAAALVLALVGVYGLVAYTVAERTRELGVRVALGARPADVYRTVLGGSARLAGVGLAAGAALALALTRVLASALPNVSPREPGVLAGVVAGRPSRGAARRVTLGTRRPAA